MWNVWRKRLIVGDVGGKAECEVVLLFAYLFLERRNEECCLFYAYLRPTNCSTLIVCKSTVLLKYKKECLFICALEMMKVSSFPEDRDKMINYLRLMQSQIEVDVFAVIMMISFCDLVLWGIFL